MLNSTRLLVSVFALALITAVCSPKPSTDPRVAELEKELVALKQELAANKDTQAGQAAAAGGALETAKAAQDTATSAQQTAATAASQAEQATRDRESTEKALASTGKALADQKAALTEQKAATARQADENARLRRELDELKPREFTLPAGTVIPARTTAEISTSKVKNGSVFEAVLENDLVSGGTTLAKAGALVNCIVVSSDPGGKVKGVASLSVAAKSIAGVGGNTFTVKTETYSVEAGTTKKRDALRTGIAAGAGAIIGGIAGGGKGAAIGAGAGAAAGVGTNLITRGDAAVLPTESLIEFTLSAPATVVLRK